MLMFLNPSGPTPLSRGHHWPRRLCLPGDMGNPGTPDLRVGFGDLLCFPISNLSRVCMSWLPAVCQPPGALERGQASPYLSPGGDFQSPHYPLCPSNGALPNCLLSPPCPAGSLLCSFPEPGRLIKTCVVLAQGTRHDSGASGTGTAPARLPVLRHRPY